MNPIRAHSCIITAIFVFAVASRAQAVAPHYSLTAIGSGDPHSVNDSGQVVFEVGGGECAWVSSDGTQGQDFGHPSHAYGISNNGQIAGLYNSHPYLWTTSGGSLDLTTVGCPLTQVESVNDGGQIVGTTNNHASIWSSSDGFQDLGTLNPLGLFHFSYGQLINNVSQVAGSAYVNDLGALHAFLWTSGVMQDLGALDDSQNPYSYSIPYGMNNLGHVAGTSSFALDSVHAVCWTSSGIHDLGSGNAFGIDDSDEVVGENGELGGAFIWTSANGMQNLNDLIDPSQFPAGRGPLVTARAISDDGHYIVADDSGGAMFLLTAVPEPSAFVLGALAIVLLIAVRRKRARTQAQGALPKKSFGCAFACDSNSGLLPDVVT